MAPYTEGEAAKVTISFLSLQNERQRGSMKHDNEIPHTSRDTQLGSKEACHAAL